MRASLTSTSLLFDHSNGLPGGPYLALAGNGGKIAGATDEGIFTFDWKQRQVKIATGNLGHIWSLRASPEGVLVAENSGIDLFSDDGFQKSLSKRTGRVCSRRLEGRAAEDSGSLAGRQLLQYDQTTGRRETVVPDLAAGYCHKHFRGRKPSSVVRYRLMLARWSRLVDGELDDPGWLGRRRVCP